MSSYSLDQNITSQQFSSPFMNIGDSAVAPHFTSIIMDNTITLVPHISSVVKAASFQLRNLGKIRKYLTPEATEQLVHAFITSRLDMGIKMPCYLDCRWTKFADFSLSKTKVAGSFIRTRPSAHNHLF